MRTVDPTKHAARRQHILDAAATCFSRNGFDATTTAQICREAGVSSGSLFHYFPSKLAVFLAVFEQDGERTTALLEQARTAEDPWAAVLDVLAHLCEDASHPIAPGLVLAVVAAAQREPQIAELLERNDVEAAAGLTALLDAAAQQGQIRADVDPSAAAAWALGLVDVLYLRADPDRGFDPREQTRTLQVLLARYLGAPEPTGAD